MLPSPCVDKIKHVSCRMVDETQRQLIYSKFRSLLSVDDQRQFIGNHVTRHPKNRTTGNRTNSRRLYTSHYTLPVGAEKIKVCRDFFMATLNITDAQTRTPLNFMNEDIIIKDKRGKHIPHNKLSVAEETFIRNHILSFPAVESHYTRKSSSTKYLVPSLRNMSALYELYKEKCASEGRKYASLQKYCAIFKEYKLSFFKPKKDQCKKCVAFQNMTQDEKLKNQESHNEHLSRRTLARESRNDDKEKCLEDPSILSFNFDLQAVLNTPKGPAGQIFYLRKYAVYNLTIYNLGSKEAICYLWSESNGNRGANEIASCIYDYVMSKSGVKEVRMMSDSCGGQQKNFIFSTMCLELVKRHPTLEIINHKYFETGHTEMECDSIHSKIERCAKFIPVYVPDGWSQVIRTARKNPAPFIVRSMNVNDFFNFKAVASPGVRKVPFRSICRLQYKKNCSQISYKTNFNEEFQHVEEKRRGRPSNAILPAAYSDEIPIAAAKYKDLQKMCADLTIPKEHHQFYKNLKSNANVRDCLQEPDAEESDEDY